MGENYEARRKLRQATLALIATVVGSILVQFCLIEGENLYQRAQLTEAGWNRHTALSLQPSYSDFPAFLIWVVGLALLVGALTPFLSPQTSRRPGALACALSVLLGIGIGVAWTILVGVVLGPGAGAFSFPPAWGWTGGAIVGCLAGRLASTMPNG